MSLPYQFSRPFAFLSIEHKVLRFITWIIPTALTVLVSIPFLLLSRELHVFGDRSFTSYTISILTTLPGFFVAALAVVATFNRPELDYEMPKPIPEIKIRTANREGKTQLTLRVFLCYMFAYLTAVSLLAIGLCVFADLLVDGLADTIRASNGLNQQYDLIVDSLRCVYVFVISWLNCSIFVVTMYSLYFLCERIHRPNA